MCLLSNGNIVIMSNIKKTLLYTTIYNVGFMFCSGAIIQTFLLQIGFNDDQVYLYNSLIQFAQVAMMVIMIFLANKVKRVKWAVGLAYLSMAVMASIFLFGAIDKDILLKPYVIVVFIVGASTYFVGGLHIVLSYVLPFYTIDMEEYGKMTGLGVMLAGGCSFALSFLHAFIVSKFDYRQSMIWFFVLAIVCFILTSIICLSLKEIPPPKDENKKSSIVDVFKNRDTYLLILPNFARGLAAGIMSVITVLAISSNIIDEKTSSIVNVIMQIAMFAGNLLYIFTYKKLSSKVWLILSTIGICVIFPLCLLGGKIWFFCIFFVAYLARMITDTAIPVLVAEIIPKEQIVAYTSIRMLIFTGAQAVATLIINPIVGVVGYTGLLIFAAIMQAICGVGYCMCAHFKKKEDKPLSESAQ